jgi:hypothetical protein
MSNNFVKVFQFILPVKFFLIFIMTIFDAFYGYPQKQGDMKDQEAIRQELKNITPCAGQHPRSPGTGSPERLSSKQLAMKALIPMLIVSLLIGGCRPKFNHEVTTNELRDIVYFLASDSLKGRKPGTPEDSVLTAYIVERFDISGMVPVGETGLQEVKVESGFTVTDQNRVTIGSGSEAIIRGNDLLIPGFSATDTVSGELILSTHVPESASSIAAGNILTMPFPSDLPGNPYDAYGFLRSQCLSAADNGAVAVVYFATGPLPSLESDKRLPLPIPVVVIKGDPATKVLQSGNGGGIFGMIRSFDNATVSTGLQATIMTEVLPVELTTHNTLATLKGGNRELSDQYIIIGAHHDHLGMGGRGSSSRRQDTLAVHYGADDNASGVAGVIELSQHLMSRSPQRSFLFTTFAAEEMGLLGSRTQAANPVVDLEKVQVMINLDMIGRLNPERQLQIGGVGTSPVFRTLLDSLNMQHNFSMAYSEAGYGPSDHSSFYAEDVPVLFISTGAHTDYHTPADTPEKLDYEGMKDVLYFVSDLAYALSEMPEKIPFTMAGPKESSGSRGRQGMVTFGLMPDVMYDGSEGMPVSFVTEGKPAAIAGMKGGDIIKAVDGKRIGNVHDYMERLSELKEGQSVIVQVERDGVSLELLLKL